MDLTQSPNFLFASDWQVEAPMVLQDGEYTYKETHHA